MLKNRLAESKRDIKTSHCFDELHSVYGGLDRDSEAFRRSMETDIDQLRFLIWCIENREKIERRCLSGICDNLAWKEMSMVSKKADSVLGGKKLPQEKVDLNDPRIKEKIAYVDKCHEEIEKRKHVPTEAWHQIINR